MIKVLEEFDDPIGQLHDYDNTALESTREALLARTHVNVRSFVGTDTVIPQTFFFIDAETMTVLDAETMTVIEGAGGTTTGGTAAYFPGEQWTNSTIESYAGLAGYNVLKITMSGAGTKTATSIIQPPSPSIFNAPSTIRTVDLSTGFLSTDNVSLALPTFPASSLTLASCKVEFTSDQFTTYASIPFSASVTGLITGNSELSFPVSYLTNPTYKVGAGVIDPTAINGVRITVVATGACSVRVAGFRLLGSAWQSAPLEADTVYKRLKKGLSRTGTFSYDVASWPTLTKTEVPDSGNGPKPINGTVTTAFFTGSSAASNSVTLYHRQRTEDYLTQLDLNGTFIQADLDQYGTQLETIGGTPIFGTNLPPLPGVPGQPDFGRALYESRTQADLETLDQAELDADDQSDLEREDDLTAASYVTATLAWTGTSATVTIKSSETTGGSEYVLDATIAAATEYVLVTKFQDNAYRAQICSRTYGHVGPAIADTGWIFDSTMFKRRAGTLAWNATLGDGDAWVDNINPSGLTYAEYRSHTFRSRTPVEGVELFATTTPNANLATGLSPGPFGGTLSGDLSKKNSSDGSIRIDSAGTSSFQGWQTNLILIEDWENTVITFDLYVPRRALDAGLTYLPIMVDSKGTNFTMQMPTLVADQWQIIRIKPVPGYNEQSGYWRFALMESGDPIRVTWWVDNVAVSQRSIAWSAKAERPDHFWPQRAVWMPFEDTISQPGNGIRLARRGRHVQVRGLGRRQDSQINRVSVKPKYAELGRLMWTDPPVVSGPTASFTDTNTSGRSYGFTSTSTAGSGSLISYAWDFGDGEFEFVANPSHTYAAAGTYTVVLNVVNSYGLASSTTASLVVA